jgi:hypothetical protein
VVIELLLGDSHSVLITTSSPYGSYMAGKYRNLNKKVPSRLSLQQVSRMAAVHCAAISTSFFFVCPPKGGAWF